MGNNRGDNTLRVKSDPVNRSGDLAFSFESEFWSIMVGSTITTNVPLRGSLGVCYEHFLPFTEW
jgi:hypothetical protein